MAVKNQRVRLYKMADVGSDGNTDQSYVLQSSNATDAAYWAAVSYISGRDSTVGGQAEHVVIYDVTVDTVVPVANTDDAVFTVMPDETQVLKIQSVGLLFNTGEKQARCLDVSDANHTLVT